MTPKPGSILIVDDDPVICTMLAILMKEEGLATRVANDGETALQMVAVESPDLLLVDSGCPASMAWKF